MLFSLLGIAVLLLPHFAQGRPHLYSQPLLTIEPRKRTAPEPQDTDDPTEWLKANAITLKSTTPGSDSSDLNRLKDVLRGVRIVGLGEATHNTREFAAVKHRILEFLVSEMGFNVFAIEANYATCLEINDYVWGAKIDRGALLEDLFDIWRTEEVMALIEWVRAYNAKTPNAKKVKFYGFDIQEVLQARSVVINYLRAVDAPDDRVRQTKRVVQTLWGVMDAAPAYGAGSTLSSLLPDLRESLKYFADNETDFVRRTSRAEYEKALLHLRLLFQDADSFIEDNDKRDRYMAENLLYTLKHERPGARMIVWAHNIHISKGEYYIPGRGYNMGHYLRRALGQAYYAFGFAFGEGSFLALERTYKTSDADDLKKHTIGAPPANSLDWYLAQPAIGDYIIDLRHMPGDEKLQRWLTTTRGMRQAGGDKVPANINHLWRAGKELFPVRLSTDYDGMVFIEKMSAAKQLRLDTSNHR